MILETYFIYEVMLAILGSNGGYGKYIGKKD